MRLFLLQLLYAAAVDARRRTDRHVASPFEMQRIYTAIIKEHA